MTPEAAGEPTEPDPLLRIRPYLPGQPATGTPEPTRPPETGGPGEHPAGTELDGRSPALPGPRPFVLTAGRVTGADPEIGLETQVTARRDGGAWMVPPLSRLAPELQAIVALCAEPTSVAELSARTRMHLGVTRVLVGDLRVAGHLDVHIHDVEDAHDPDIILRVIDGLRAIS